LHIVKLILIAFDLNLTRILVCYHQSNVEYRVSNILRAKDSLIVSIYYFGLANAKTTTNYAKRYATQISAA